MSKTPFKVNVSVVIKNGSKILLIRRADDEEVFPGYWGIPGGTVEQTDTTLEAALQRECDEEVDVQIKNPSVVANNIVNKDDKAVLYIVYQAEYVSGEPKPLDGTAEVAWLSYDAIKPLHLTPTTLESIELCL